MPYQLKFDEPIEAGWHRIVNEQIDGALSLLRSGRDVDVAIHETRKSMKRVRALLKLLRPGLSTSDYRRENKRFGDIARGLSALRDKAVLAQTARMLADQTSGKSRAAALAFVSAGEEQTGARQAAGAVDAARQADVSERVGAAIAELERARRAVDRLKLKSNSFSVVRRGLARNYKAGAKGMAPGFQARRRRAVP